MFPFYKKSSPYNICHITNGQGSIHNYTWDNLQSVVYNQLPFGRNPIT